MTSVQTQVERVAGYGVIALCVYETVALTSGRCPTVSALCRRYRVIELTMIGLFMVHLHYEQRLEAALVQALRRGRPGEV